MAPARPASSSSAAGPKSSSGRPKIFGGDGTRRSARIEKRSATGDGRTKEPRQEKDQDPTAAESEQNTQPQQTRPGSEVTETRSSRRLAGNALPSDRCLRRRSVRENTTARGTNQGVSVDDGEDQSREAALCHTISEGGPMLKNIAELIFEIDIYHNFKIPADKIIAKEDVDMRVRQVMQRHAQKGNLTPKRVRNYLIKSVEVFEACWSIRSRRSAEKFWERACTRDKSSTPYTWMCQIDGEDCRQFFLWLLVYFRNGSGRKGTNELIRAFETLDKMFEEEEKVKDSELNELQDVELRLQQPALQQPALQSPARSHGRTTVSRGAASKSKGGKTVADDGNIFHQSADTNMTDFDLSGIDFEGLTPVVDVGDTRRKNEAQERRIYQEVDKARIENESAAKEAAQEGATAQRAAASLAAVATPHPQPTAQGRRRSHRQRPTPSEVANLMPQMGVEGPLKAGRKFSEFEVDEEDDDGEEEERQRAAARKRQKMLQEHAAKGGPKSD